MAFEVIIAMESNDGHNAVRKLAWNKDLHKLIGALAKEHNLGQYQRQQLRIKGKTSQKKTDGTVTIEITGAKGRFDKDGKNSLFGKPPAIIELADGNKLDWHALPDKIRNKLAQQYPELPKMIARAIADQESEQTEVPREDA